MTQRERLIMWQAWTELNEIRARDGVPWTHQGYQSSVSAEYFSSVVDGLAECLGDDAQPWPPEVEYPEHG